MSEDAPIVPEDAPVADKRAALIALLDGWTSPSMRPFNDRLADAILDLLGGH